MALFHNKTLMSIIQSSINQVLLAVAKSGKGVKPILLLVTRATVATMHIEKQYKCLLKQ